MDGPRISKLRSGCRLAEEVKRKLTSELRKLPVAPGSLRAPIAAWRTAGAKSTLTICFAFYKCSGRTLRKSGPVRNGHRINPWTTKTCSSLLLVPTRLLTWPDCAQNCARKETKRADSGWHGPLVQPAQRRCPWWRCKWRRTPAAWGSACWHFSTTGVVLASVR